MSDNYENVPSELLAGVDVYKSPMADQIDGGIGGLVNFRTRRPFDFSGAEFAGSARSTYADQAEKPGYAGSLLLSDRWSPEIGDIGALLSVSYSRRNFCRVGGRYPLSTGSDQARPRIASSLEKIQLGSIHPECTDVTPGGGRAVMPDRYRLLS